MGKILFDDWSACKSVSKFKRLSQRSGCPWPSFARKAQLHSTKNGIEPTHVKEEDKFFYKKYQRKKQPTLSLRKMSYLTQGKDP